jgi:hypothetical protein
VVFPYPSLEPPDPVEIGISSGFPFVLHGSRRLFFPKNWTRSKVEKTYRSFVEQENIIGEGEKYPRPLAKTPHQYMGGPVKVESGDVVVDIGAAEGLFSLNIAERASKIVLIENDSQWFAPLERTFEPFQDKTVIVKKAVGDRDSRHSIRLSTALRDVPDDRVFVKMDIEGAEVSVVDASRDLLGSPRDIRWACCTYHRANDADALEKIFRSEGYSTEFSDGWMLFLHHRLEPPFFRHGVIRAWRPFHLGFGEVTAVRRIADCSCFAREERDAPK